MNSWLTISTILLFMCTLAHGQDCAQKLEEATRSYYQGNLRQVEELLQPCIDQGFTKSEKANAHWLLANSQILLNQNDHANENIRSLLETDPNYQLKKTDLVEFQNLFNQYQIETKYSLGIIAGVFQPDYIIMRHHSYASETTESADYNEIPGIAIGITGDYLLLPHLYSNLSLIWERSSFEQEEIILGFQSVFSRETYNSLSLPLQIRYFHDLQNFSLFVGSGFALNYLIDANADLDHSPIEPRFPTPFIGIPKEADNYDISAQRKSLTGNWVFSAGFQRKINDLLLEFRFSYQVGIYNLVKEKNRYSDRILLDDFAYVPDDFSRNSMTFSIGILRNFTHPVKR